MDNNSNLIRKLREELNETLSRLSEAEQELNAIRYGEVDSLLVKTSGNNQVLTLEGAQDPYHLLIDQMSESVATLSTEGIILYTNNSFTQLFKLPKNHLLGLKLEELFVSKNHPLIKEMIDTAGQNENCYKEISIEPSEGVQILLRLGLTSMQIGRTAVLFLIVNDLTEQKKHEEELNRILSNQEQLIKKRTKKLSRELSRRMKNEEKILSLSKELQTIFDSSPEMIFYKDKENNFIRINDNFSKTIDIPTKEIEGKSSWDIFPKELADHYWRKDKEVIESGKPTLDIVEKLKTPHKTLTVRTDKTPYRDSNGNILGVIGFAKDITELQDIENKLRKQNELLHYCATYDSLTQITNRHAFIQSANLVFNSAKRYNRILAVLMLDIDNFKWINDYYGHNIGDMVLKSVAAIIEQHTRKSDLTARLGGDEFGIMLSEMANIDDAALFANKLLNIFKEPLKINGYSITCSVSVGIACYPSDDVNKLEDLLKQADIAMYEAKEKGKNSFVVFQYEVFSKYLKKTKMEALLKDTLKRDKFYLHYQPIVDMRSNNIVGAEALLRMPKSKEFGIISPYAFIPVAANLNIIQDMDYRTFEKVCKNINDWNIRNENDFFFSVNVSPKQINMKDFFTKYDNIITKYNIDTNLLELELTETEFGRVLNDTLSNWLEKFEKYNFKLSIDDFGTGYSSLNRIGRLPVSTIKIDGSFVHNIGKSKKHNAIITNIIRLADALAVKIIAECVETQEQADFLVKNGCHLAQGFYYYKPMPAEELKKTASL